MANESVKIEVPTEIKPPVEKPVIPSGPNVFMRHVREGTSWVAPEYVEAMKKRGFALVPYAS